jgi:hypothetical protein
MEEVRSASVAREFRDEPGARAGCHGGPAALAARSATLTESALVLAVASASLWPEAAWRAVQIDEGF